MQASIPGQSIRPAGAEFAGKAALVTGAGSGIGAEIARRLAAAGAAVAVTDFDAEAAARVAAGIGSAGGRAIALDLDVCDPSSVEAGVAACEAAFGGLHLAVNNAGIDLPRCPTGAYPLDRWHRIIDVNLNGVFHALRFEVPAMIRAGGGAIVNIASIMGLRGIAGQPAYTAAKHGVVGLTRAAALDCAGDGIRVNAVAPGFVETPLLDHLPPAAKAEAAARHPVGRLGRPAEIAEVVLFLLSDRASFVAGACYEADGGYLAR